MVQGSFTLPCPAKNPFGVRWSWTRARQGRLWSPTNVRAGIGGGKGSVTIHAATPRARRWLVGVGPRKEPTVAQDTTVWSCCVTTVSLSAAMTEGTSSLLFPPLCPCLALPWRAGERGCAGDSNVDNGDDDDNDGDDETKKRRRIPTCCVPLKDNGSLVGSKADKGYQGRPRSQGAGQCLKATVTGGRRCTLRRCVLLSLV